MNPAWALLGIEPTEDKRAIKRAYAAKLKATDVEADPKAFIALREAFENANWEAEYLPYRDEDEDEDGAAVESFEASDTASSDPVVPDFSPITDAELGGSPLPYAFDPAPATSMPPAEDGALDHDDDEDEDEDEDPATWRWEPQRQPETEADQERIVQLLWGDEPAEEIQVELAERTHRILSAPEMEQIDHAASIEDWMASIIAQSVPRSDAMARIAVPHFRWSADADNWRQRYGISQAVARFAEFEALDRLEDPAHRWHTAWNLLKQPPPDAKGWKDVVKYREDIVGLMQSIRYHSPGIESALNAEHVALWEKASAKPGSTSSSGGGWNFKWWWWVLIGLYAFVQFARFAGDSPPSNSVTPPTIAADNLIDFAQWRAEQSSAVQQWMDSHRDKVYELIDHQRERGGGLPSCAALDAYASLTREQYVHCEDAEQKRRPRAPPAAGAMPVPMATTTQSGTRMVYSSPRWRGEQAPRVQKWMDSHPDELDRMLQPFVRTGGLPGCGVLGLAAGMSEGEKAQCRAGEAARKARQAAVVAPVRPQMNAAPSAPQLKVSDTQLKEMMNSADELRDFVRKAEALKADDPAAAPE